MSSGGGSCPTLSTWSAGWPKSTSSPTTLSRLGCSTRPWLYKDQRTHVSTNKCGYQEPLHALTSTHTAHNTRTMHATHSTHLTHIPHTFHTRTAPDDAAPARLEPALPWHTAAQGWVPPPALQAWPARCAMWAARAAWQKTPAACADGQSVIAVPPSTVAGDAAGLPHAPHPVSQWWICPLFLYVAGRPARCEQRWRCPVQRRRLLGGCVCPGHFAAAGRWMPVLLPSVEDSAG